MRPVSIQVRARDAQARLLADELIPADDEPVPGVPRPRTRGECGDERPCPWVSCRHHLYLDISPVTGSIKLNFPGRELEDIDESCSLDVAERGSSTLAQIAKRLNVTRQGVALVEHRALVKAKAGHLR